jgi:multiple sugar transport system substrate-binding protein
MKKTVRLYSLITGFLMVLSVSAWSNGSSSTSSGSNSAGPEKVYLYNWTNADNMKPLLEAFNKEYAGKYEMVYEKLADSGTMTINTALASGSPITVMTQASAFDLRQRADAGNYLGLKQFFDKEGQTYEGVFGQSIERTQNIGGDYYSTPYCNNIYMVLFNKKMFDDAGIPYPDPNWTWADFRETAKKFTKGSGADKVYGVMSSLENAGLYDNWAMNAQQKLGNFWYYSPDFKSTRFNAPEIKESLQLVYDMFMVDKSCVPMEEYKTLRYTDGVTAIRALANGRFAMWISPLFVCMYLNKPYGEIPPGTDIGMTNLPRPVGSGGLVNVSYTSTASIPANVKNPEAAWIALKYITIDHAEFFAGPKAMHPGYQFKTIEEANAFNDLIFRNHPGFDYDMAMKVMALPRTVINRDNTIFQGQAKINALLNANMSLVFNGEMSVDTALKDLKTKGDQYIAEDLK